MLLYDQNIIGPSSEIFGYLRKSLENNVWKMFGNVHLALENLRKVVGDLPKIVLYVVISMFV